MEFGFNFDVFYSYGLLRGARLFIVACSTSWR